MRPFNRSIQLDPSKLYYLCTVYSSYPTGLEPAHHHAALITGRLLKQGALVYCPIVHGHTPSIAADLDKTSHDFWITLDKRYINRCDELLVAMMPNWEISKGIGMEIQYANDTGKSVNYMCPVTLRVYTSPVELSSRAAVMQANQTLHLPPDLQGTLP